MAKLPLKRQAMLKSTRDIDALFNSGQLYRFRAFNMIVRRDAGTKKVLVATARAIGTHVARNRAKRRLRELYRLHQHRFPEDAHLGFIAKPGILRSSFADLNQDFLHALNTL